MASEPTTGIPVDEMKAVLYKLTNYDFTEIMVAIDCGELSALKQLTICDEQLRDAVTIMNSRWSKREQAAIFKRLCGCAIAPTAPTNFPKASEPETQPASLPVPVQQTQPQATTPPVESKCSPELPPEKSFT